ncbi:MAG TPA: PhnD/SsuA/transferrin family substrate-binding protein [Paraburkholderia sp.]|jgi:ABC-type phosphate/phosphonate transport system substrate-binding protein|nr:PhnD/SsuA/transferrin family substrate-binding protein [Paraburkholderia sp.]
MPAHWVAALPMYNVTPALGALWRAFAHDVAVFAFGGDAANDVSLLDEPFGDLRGLWRRNDLLLSQTCGYPLVHELASHVDMIATPIFDANGCDGARYRSVLVVRSNGDARVIDTLTDCRGLRAAYNGDDSNSGMNALRHAVAPLARGGRFFGSVVRTGSHLASLRRVAAGDADVAAIDCVTLAYVSDELPDLAKRVRGIGFTASTPGLPLIASRSVGAARLSRVRDALHAALSADRERARRLRLRGFARLTANDYAAIDALERDAMAAGYATLA